MSLLFFCQKNSLIRAITLINKSQQTIDNRRQTEGNQVYLNCRGAKEEKTTKWD